MAPLLLAVGLIVQLPAPPPRDAVTAATPPAHYSIGGRVTDASTGQAIRNAAITIRSAHDGDVMPRGTLTDSDGNWEFAGLPAGDYVLNHSKPGYTRVRGVRIYSPVHVSQQFPKRHLELVLARGGVITGRVVDPSGEPAVRAVVSAFVVVNGQINWSQFQDQTDDRGEFRLFGLSPGDYVISATPVGGDDGVPEIVREGQALIPTYYPATVRPEEAERLTIVEEGALADLSIQLQTARTFKVSGQVLGPKGEVESVQVHLESASGELGPGLHRGASGFVRQSGLHFEIDRVLPGQYKVVANVKVDEGDERGEAVVVVSDADVTVTISTRKPTIVRGRVVASSGSLRAVGRLQAMAAPTGPGLGAAFSRRVRDDGTFEVTTFASPFQMRVWGESGPGNWTQKEVRWKGQVVGSEGIIAGEGDVEGIEVVLTASTARVQGVAARGGVPLREGMVIIAPETAPAAASGTWAWQRAVIVEGRFVSPPLAPGRYFVAATTAVAPGAITPDVVQAVRERGDSVELSDNEVRTVTVGVVVDQ